MRLPNLIVAGTSKAGSSSLFYWLEAHPEVYGAASKETFYFMDSDSTLFKPEASYHLHGLDGYQAFFPNCPEEAKIVVEATPHYIYQKTALDFFASCDPQPHIIFLLRKPSKRIFSDFSFTQNYLGYLDSRLTFNRVTDLLLNDGRDRLEDLGYSNQDFLKQWLEDQLPNNRYYEVINRWAKHFPPEKIQILLFEKMVANPVETLCSVSERLGIDANFYREFHFEKRTQTMAIKNKLVHQLLLKFAPYLSTSKLRSTLKSMYFKLNSSAVKPAELESLRRLDDYFRPHNQLLAEAFNLNLDCWN
jgi:Sulfotransferase domain